MNYDPLRQWNATINRELAMNAYPAQGLIRILRGSFPDLIPFEKGGKALDIGCGDGRNSVFLANEGYEVTGTEITPEIALELGKKFSGIRFNVGTCGKVEDPPETYDLIVAWHAIYYMGLESSKVEEHFSEMRRVIKSAENSRFILSVPMPQTFIYKNSKFISNLNGVDYVEITEDPHDTRVGETLARFPNFETLKDRLEFTGWKSIQLGEEMGLWFGREYNWWDIVCVPN